jgi:ankyrin repeat protein
MLIDVGLANQVDSNGRNPLHFACLLGVLNAATMIFAHNEDLVRQTVCSLCLSVSLSLPRLAMHCTLIAHSIVQQYGAGRTLLHAAVELRKDEIFDCDDERMMEWLTQFLKISPLQADNNGVTPLHLAAHSGRYDALEVLLDCIDTSQSIDVVDKHGRTPFHYATITNSVKVC